MAFGGLKGLASKIGRRKKKKDAKSGEKEQNDEDDDEEYEDEEMEAKPEGGKKVVKEEEAEEEVIERRQTQAQKQRAVRRFVHSLVIVLLFLCMVAVRSQANAAAAALADWRDAKCELTAYAGDCHSCEMIVQIYHSTIEPIANWKPEFTFSYYTGNYVLRGEQFKCCNADPPTCCNFWDQSKEQFCDAYGPLVMTEKGDEACPMGAWDCMFRLKDDPNVEEYEIVPGKDETLPALQTLSSVVTGSAVVLALLHPFVWEQARAMLVMIAETIVMRYFRKMRARHDEQVEEERKRKRKLRPPVVQTEEEELDDRPIDAPLVEPLSPWDANAAALRWKNVDPLLTGTVSAHALRPREGSPLHPSELPPGLSMNMTAGSSSIYGPSFLPGVPTDVYGEGMEGLPRSAVETPPRVDTRNDWRFDHARSPTAFVATAERVRKGTARDLAGRGAAMPLRGAGRLKPGTLRESGKYPSSSLNRSGSNWGYSSGTPASDMGASCSSFYGEEGRLREQQRQLIAAQSTPLGLGSPPVRRKLNFDGDERYGFRAQHLADRDPRNRKDSGRRGAATSNDRYAHHDGYVSFVRPPEKLATPERPSSLPPGLSSGGRRPPRS